MDLSKLQPEAFFDLDSFEHPLLFEDCRYVWEGLRTIEGYLKEHLTGNVKAVGSFRQPLLETMVLWRGRIWREGFDLLGGDVTQGNSRVRIEGEETGDAIVLYAGSILWDDQIHLGPGSVVEPGALIQGPTIIGAQTEVRQGAYVRGNCIIGNRCVVGHTTEIKGSVMLNDAKAGHFAYIGDSILGNATNLGAGTKLANLKIKAGTVWVKAGRARLDTGLRKFGAVLGDNVEIGCNAVTNPGTLLGKGSLVFPVTSVPSGYHEPKSVVR
jgi:UDP-N-acetylglucosamine diphosphorylase / glucose-1-phosphate thymidylyltransferase / UDP-N-acetylgalactosamine diphosphorylase / glucosamine-1-phosphate N-acetyltransferase / galactosamine-1-phosphate N-acetyltransferase